MKVRISTKRGYYMPSGADLPAEIATSESSTAVHEYLHHLQAKLPGLDALFQELHRVRTAGEPRVSIGHREWARIDHYYSTYQGREYGGPNSALEVLTMALQPVLGSDLKALRMLKEMMEHDREMLELALGVLFNWKV